MDIRVKIPKTQFSEASVRNALSAPMNRAAKRVTTDFKNGVKTWDHRPSFRTVPTSLSGNRLSKLIKPDEPNLKQYLYVHNGVYPRMIYPRRAKSLRFQPYYSPATHRGVIESRARKKRGGKYIYRKAVRWPGIEPRAFSFFIAKKQRPMFVTDVRLAISKLQYGW